MDNLDLIWWCLLAFLIGIWWWSRRLKKHVDEMHKEIQQLLSKIIFMRTETHGDVIYAYNAFNNEFVCQGKDLEELSEQFGKRYPDRKGVIVKPDEEKAT